MNEIAVIGHPSLVGGADTELDHQIQVWQALGFRVNIIHTNHLDENQRAMKLEERGCVIHDPRNWKACKGMPVISYCNDQFLENIEEIRDSASHTFWVNCMSWIFPAEKVAHEKGLIDQFIYQTKRVKKLSGETLKKINSNFKASVVSPYFNADRFPFIKNREFDKFRFCRISREDLGKFHESQLWIYDTMVAPVLKEGVILGFNEKIRRKIGQLPSWISGHPAGALKVEEIYKKSHSLIQIADPSLTENLPRIGFEAMASGCVLCVDKRGGWEEEVMHGETGFLCEDQREFVYFASRIAYESKEREEMASNARDHLETNWGKDVAMKSWSKFFNNALG